MHDATAKTIEKRAGNFVYVEMHKQVTRDFAWRVYDLVHAMLDMNQSFDTTIYDGIDDVSMEVKNEMPI